MIVYRVAKSLDLSVQLKAICRGNYVGSDDEDDDEDSCTDFIVTVPSFQHRDHALKYPDVSDEEKLEYEFRNADFRNVETAENVRWCVWTKKRNVLLLTSYDLLSGEEYQYYQSAALLIEVPEFTSGRGGAFVKTVLNHIEEVGEEIRRSEAAGLALCSAKAEKLVTERNELMQKLVTERNELMHMIPPAKRVKKI